ARRDEVPGRSLARVRTVGPASAHAAAPKGRLTTFRGAAAAARFTNPRCASILIPIDGNLEACWQLGRENPSRFLCLDLVCLRGDVGNPVSARRGAAAVARSLVGCARTADRTGEGLH